MSIVCKIVGMGGIPSFLPLCILAVTCYNIVKATKYKDMSRYSKLNENGAEIAARA
jgi:hypothetical protein